MGVPDTRACLARKVLSVGLSIDKETFSQVDYGLFAERLQAVVALLDRYLEKLDQGCPVGEWTVPN